MDLRSRTGGARDLKEFIGTNHYGIASIVELPEGELAVGLNRSERGVDRTFFELFVPFKGETRKIGSYPLELTPLYNVKYVVGKDRHYMFQTTAKAIDKTRGIFTTTFWGLSFDPEKLGPQTIETVLLVVAP